MQTEIDRLRRHNHQPHVLLRRQRAAGRARWVVALFACLALACWVAPAQARTGGASTAHRGDFPGKHIAFGAMRSAGATWYGPGLYGRRTACGQVLRPNVIGVAHRRLPCGTVVKFAYRGRAILTTVIDRGPYARGYKWDLTNGARLALGLDGSDRVRYAVSRRYKRR